MWGNSQKYFVRENRCRQWFNFQRVAARNLYSGLSSRGNLAFACLFRGKKKRGHTFESGV